MENVKVIDNFLPDYHFKQFQTVLMADDFPWYYNEGIVRDDDGKFQFIHGFYKNAMVEPYLGKERRSNNFAAIGSILPQLGVKDLIKVKANLRPKTFFHRSSDYHVDLTNGPIGQKTAILYINTCNGYTKIKGYGKVKSVANRLVIFPGHVQHAGVSCTDENTRIVVNFNYR
jgi:hypothetical protein